MTRTVYDSGALPRSVHAQFRFDDFYPERIRSLMSRPGVVVDIGTGVGRDAVAIHTRAGRDGALRVIGLDPDEENFRQAVETYPDKGIVLCRDWDEVAGVDPVHQIAYLVRELQKADAPPDSLRADFINCSAVLMFVSPDEHKACLDSLKNMLEPDGHVFLRFRTEMLKDGMHRIDPETLRGQCRDAGFDIETLPRFADPPPTRRDFKWHDWLLKPTGI